MPRVLVRGSISANGKGYPREWVRNSEQSNGYYRGGSKRVSKSGSTGVSVKVLCALAQERAKMFCKVTGSSAVSGRYTTSPRSFQVQLLDSRRRFAHDTPFVLTIPRMSLLVIILRRTGACVRGRMICRGYWERCGRRWGHRKGLGLSDDVYAHPRTPGKNFPFERSAQRVHFGVKSSRR